MIVAYFSVFVGIVLAIFMNMYPDHKTAQEQFVVQPLPTPTRSNTKKTKNNNKKEDGLVKEAKEMLVNMGYSATEAKELLSGVSGSSVQDYVQKAMEKVKI